MKEIIYKYLKSLNINGLAAFKNGPAIFLDQAPDDSDSRWDGSQYGRIIYGLNLKDDSERKVSGTMEIAIAYLFNNQGYKNLLEAKKILKKAFEGVFLTDEDTTISLVWRKSESFQEAIEGQMDVEVCGSVLTFDAYAFPKHSYLPLDAVGSLAKHIDENWNVTVINNTELDEIWKPDDEEVVVYTRLDSMQPPRRRVSPYLAIFKQASATPCSAVRLPLTTTICTPMRKDRMVSRGPFQNRQRSSGRSTRSTSAATALI